MDSKGAYPRFGLRRSSHPKYGGVFVAALLVAACAAKPGPVSSGPPQLADPSASKGAPASAVSPPATASGEHPSTRAPGDSVTTRERSTTPVAAGIYVIRHEDAPDTFPQGNTTVIVGERETLVVDSCYLPSSAKKDITKIQKWTTKPVPATTW